MTKLYHSAIFFLTLLLLATGCSAQPESQYKNGIHYKELAGVVQKTEDGKVPVVEFFSYACPHCFHLEPDLNQWKAHKPDYIEFNKMPAYWNPTFELMAQAYYTASILKVEDKLTPALFSAIHEQRRNLNNEADIRAIFVDKGVPAEDFDKMFNSFAVRQKMKMASNLFKKYELSSVPSIIVAGKYVTSATMAGGQKELTEVINYLARQIHLNKPL